MLFIDFSQKFQSGEKYIQPTQHTALFLRSGRDIMQKSW